MGANLTQFGPTLDIPDERDISHREQWGREGIIEGIWGRGVVAVLRMEWVPRVFKKLEENYFLSVFNKGLCVRGGVGHLS